ncbi:hypothetical protein NYO99_11795 [Pelomonas sp. UHG3]|uniref:Uncharacterized protein n=1 Tax=Roseateles hydrophilus TaxID=2975054 RepID=A0ACC6CB27_9BURK|nr:hypothetical protein [Pelomonas sp. UHG3]MCY4745657.1 hypothetical protein [Pelomonas sp. UHG3]
MATKYEKASVNAVQRAFKLHWEFTGGLPLTFAPEAFIQGQIAQALHKLGLFVTLESKVYETLMEAGAEMRGKPMKRGKGRLDLVTWWKNGKPRHIIEVKKLRHKEAVTADIKRIRGILKRGGTTRQGLVIIYADAKRPDTVVRRIEFAAKTNGVKLVDRSGVQEFSSPLDNDRTRHYEAACLRVCRLPKQP